MTIKRNLFLDALRGVLAWTIVGVHILWLGGLVHSGSRGAVGSWAVDAFMVLAGYVSSASHRPERYDRYLLKKFFRLFPVLVVCGLLAEFAGTHLYVTAWFVSLLIQFYLIFPLFMWAIERYGRHVLAWLLLVSLFTYLPPIHDSFKSLAPMHELLFQNLLWFVLGMIGFELVDRYVMEDLSCYAAKHPLLVRLGELSYATYLVHWPVLFAISHIIPSELPNALRMALIAFMGVPVVLVWSVLVHLYVERPGIAHGKRLLESNPDLARI